jgi:hypothetical protein
VAEPAAQSDQISRRLSRSQLGRQEVVDAATSVTLVVNPVDRRRMQESMDRHAPDAGGMRAAFTPAGEALHGAEAVAQTAGEDELLRAHTSAFR